MDLSSLLRAIIHESSASAQIQIWWPKSFFISKQRMWSMFNYSHLLIWKEASKKATEGKKLHILLINAGQVISFIRSLRKCQDLQNRICWKQVERASLFTCWRSTSLFLATVVWIYEVYIRYYTIKVWDILRRRTLQPT